MAYSFGDNEAQITSATQPDTKMSKRHNILSFHFVRNIISAKYINLQHLKSKYNFADIVSKNWNYNDVYEEILKPIFHWEGATNKLFIDDAQPNFMIDCIPSDEEFQPMGSIKKYTAGSTHPDKSFQSLIEISVPG